MIFNENLRIVLIEPKFPENIGSISRICHNFGVKDLILVSPQCDPFDERAIKTAVDGQGVLKNARITGELDQVLDDCHLVLGTSDRVIGNKAVLDLNDPDGISWGPDSKTAIIFGREDNGLKKTELEWCDKIITISTPGTTNVLNMSHALLIILWQLVINPGKTANISVKSNILTSGEKKQLLERYVNILVINNRSETVIQKKSTSFREALHTDLEKSMYNVLGDLLSLLENSVKHI